MIYYPIKNYVRILDQLKQLLLNFDYEINK